MALPIPRLRVAYYRVSTQRQGQSGLGLEAQQKAVRDHVEEMGHKLVGEFMEVESGKNPDRPQLAEALKICRLTGARLVVARIDRLARSVSFVSAILDSSVEFEAVDFPQANRFTVQIIAAVAEYEARLISERTKAGLAAAKARGVKIGGYYRGQGNPAGLAKARTERTKRAMARAADLAPLVAELTARGYISRTAMAREFNALGIRPVCSHRWTGEMLRGVLQRLSIQIGAQEYFRARRAARATWLARIAPTLADIVGSGETTPVGIARALNRRRIPARHGGRWQCNQVRKALRDLIGPESMIDQCDVSLSGGRTLDGALSGCKPRHRVRRNPQFKRGTIFPATLQVLKRARKPLTLGDIARTLFRAKGIKQPSTRQHRALCNAVQSNLRKAEGEMVRQTRKRRPARWKLVASSIYASERGPR